MAKEGQVYDANMYYENAMTSMRYYIHQNDKGELEQALKLFTRSHESCPSVANPLVAMANCKILKGDVNSAFVDLKKALELEQKNPFVYISLGIAHKVEGKTDSAISYLKKAIDFYPLYSCKSSLYDVFNSVKLMLGVLYADKGDYVLARGYLKEAQQSTNKKVSGEAFTKEVALGSLGF